MKKKKPKMDKIQEKFQKTIKTLQKKEDSPESKKTHTDLLSEHSNK